MLDQNVPNPLAKNPNFNTHKVFASVGIILIVTIAVVAGVWYLVQSANDKVGSTVDNTVIKTATSSAIPADWKTYTDSDNTYSFKHPANWNAGKIEMQGSGYTQTFKSSDGNYTLSVLLKSNYNQSTGKPYPDIDSYVDLRTGVNLTVDGQKGIQVSPRAGTENVSDVYFFSKDSKNIIILSLETPRNDPSWDDTRAKIFKQIVSTFKFL